MTLREPFRFVFTGELSSDERRMMEQGTFDQYPDDIGLKETPIDGEGT